MGDEELGGGLGTKHLVKLWVESADEPITARANHPVWIDGRGWTDAENIGIGDRVLLPGGRTASIRLVRDLGQIAGQLVYNLTVSQIHTYIVVTNDTPFVVHNASSCPIDLKHVLAGHGANARTPGKARFRSANVREVAGLIRTTVTKGKGRPNTEASRKDLRV
ncbi:Hint domain-containing protein [Goodfellowiella coeruleoviolacea]|uniref:Hint domain-containing protein n=1 Tax=Goodfellowiella coeruleoviolacea TaxID=334858 RepID=UPI0020A511AC|nr:Hint domain-containing protein [Goodfellowiella coeruleoviolacea]